jgi:hypothetical protein
MAQAEVRAQRQARLCDRSGKQSGNAAYCGSPPVNTIPPVFYTNSCVILVIQSQQTTQRLANDTLKKVMYIWRNNEAGVLATIVALENQ